MGDSNKSKKVNTFTWSDNDIQLFLESANSFKAKCEYEARSWKSLGLKYEKITRYLLKTTQSQTKEDQCYVYTVRDRFLFRSKNLSNIV